MTNSGAQESVQILLIEDNAGDARLIREILAAVHETELVLTHTTNLADALAQVHQKSFGVMLLNLNLPDASGIDTLLRLRQHAPDVPIVVIAGLEDEATSLGAVRAGAQGYLVKTELQPSLLGRAIRYAIERQRLSGALRDSEEKYRTLLGAMADGVFVAQDYRFVFANQALATMLGYSAEAFVNVPFETVVAPEFLPLWMQRFSQRVAGGVEPPKNYEVRFLCKGAKTSLWVELRANRIQYQGRLGVLGIICDITERKRVEQAFRESEEKLRLFIEHAPAALAMFDREMRYLAFSRRWIKDYHLDDRHIAGCSHYEIFPEIPDHWKAVHQRAQQGEVVRADEDAFVRADGTVQWLRWEVRPWYLPDGSIGGIVIFTEDITERKRAEEALAGSQTRLAGIINSAMDAIITIDTAQNIVLFNPAAEAMFGLPAAAAIGQQLDRLIPQRVRQAHRQHIEAFGQTGITNRRMGKLGSIIGLRADGEEFPVEASISQIPIADQHFFTVILRDITQRKQTEEALRKSRARLQRAQTIARLGSWELDPQTQSGEWSSEWFRILERDPELGPPTPEEFLAMLHPEDVQAVLDTQQKALHTDEVLSVEFRLNPQRGVIKHITGLINREPHDDGRFILSGTIQDITERKQAEQLLFAEKERAQVTLQSIGDAVITTDAGGCVDYLNPVAAALTGWPLAEAQGQPLNKVFPVISEDTREPALDPVVRCLKEGRVIGLADHSVLVNRWGAEYAIQDSAAPIRDREGHLQGVVLVFSDVTEQRRLAAEMNYQARHDALTGLVNRREFEHRLERVIISARTDNSEHMLCYLDLDQFKVVNDTCGHAAGDELLRQLAQLFAAKVRQRDTLARLGGDEFGLLMEHCGLEQAKRVAETLRRALAEFLFVWQEKCFRVSISMGLVPIDATSGSRAAVLQAADSACYVAKDAGRDRIHIYTRDDAELAHRRGELQWISHLQEALEQDRFELYAQRIVPISQNAVSGIHCELLLRLIDAAGKPVSPAGFMPAAERYNLATRIDRWVVEHALRFFTQYPQHLAQLKLCTINLSGHSLGDASFQNFILNQLDRLTIPTKKVCFEITETAAITNFSVATHFIQALKARGCRFALDDFGSGLSSFGYLKNLPVDFLKIDGAFVKNIVDDPLDRAMVRSIHEIGHLMGKKTIAEHVENEMILNQLRLIGVDYAQGYGIGRPQPLAQLLAAK